MSWLVEQDGASNIFWLFNRCEAFWCFSSLLVVVERAMSWLVEQDGARIFLPLSNVCQRRNEKQSAKLTRTIAVLCFRFVFIFLFSSQQHQ